MSRVALAPVGRLGERSESLAERVYADLRRRLQRGLIGPGARLVDVDLARDYGTSRMPVREALLRLVNEGYLVGTTRGFALPELSPADIADLFEVRRQLEPFAAANAARDLDAESARRLDDALADARAALAAGDADALILANVEFRSAWLGAVRNRRLAETIARFVDHAQAVRLATLRDAATSRLVVSLLEGLHGAFLARDGALAKKRMIAFMAAAERAYGMVGAGRAEVPQSDKPIRPRRQA